MSDNVINLGAKRKPVRYSIHVDHYFDGHIEVCFEGIGSSSSLRDKESLLAAINEAKALVENAVDEHKRQDADSGKPCDT